MVSHVTIAGPTTVAAVLLALWIDARLGNRRPSAPTTRILHAAIAYATVRVASTAAQVVAGDLTSVSRRLCALFALLLPGLVYAFLAALWLVRTVADVAGLVRR